LKTIRSLEGFKTFLQCPPKSELLSLAESGSIVVFYVSDIRSDPFLITSDAIRSVPLPDLLPNSVDNYVGRFLKTINDQDPTQYKHATDEMNAVLGLLWRVAVEPVLRELGFNQMPRNNEDWPRVCWIANGLLSVLPIHTAGHHNAPAGQTALDFVISSYASNVKSLA